MIDDTIDKIPAKTMKYSSHTWPGNTVRWPNVNLMLGHAASWTLRHDQSKMGSCLMFTGYFTKQLTSCKTWHWSAGLSVQSRQLNKGQLMKTPSQHDTLARCWVNVGPSSKTMGQHSSNIRLTSRVCWDTLLGNITVSCRNLSNVFFIWSPSLTFPKIGWMFFFPKCLFYRPSELDLGFSLI